MAFSYAPCQKRPISVKEPTQKEIEESNELKKNIENSKLYETADEIGRREDIVTHLNDTVGKWVTSIAENQAKSKDAHGAKILTFGGYLLGIIMKDSDIDAVCIVPNFVSREDFFTSFVDILNDEPGDDVSQLRMIRGARVPIISLRLNGIQVDLCLARLTSEEIPEDLDISDNQILENMEPTDIWSLNGTRETGRILDLVPDAETFRAVLKAVKIWAKESMNRTTGHPEFSITPPATANGLHSCPMGYPGGIAWALMAARTCQMYPNAASSTILTNFFTIFKDWNRPNPVLIREPTREDVYNLKPWNPKINHSDTYHIMPVITPAYPEKNCAFSVTKSGLKVVTKQLAQASNVITRINRGELTWDDLFTLLKFFKMYKHYLMVTARASTTRDHLDWSGLVHARSRKLVEELEREPLLSLIHAYTKSYCDGNETKWFWGLEFTVTKGVKLSLGVSLEKFHKHLIELAHERNIYKPGMTINVQHVRRKDLPSILPEEEFT